MSRAKAYQLSETPQKEWFCPRCLEWFGFTDDCACSHREASRIRRSKDRGLYVAKDVQKEKS